MWKQLPDSDPQQTDVGVAIQTQEACDGYPKFQISAARFMMAPAVILLLGWMLVPLVMTLWFSFRKYLPLRGGDLGWVGF